MTLTTDRAGDPALAARLRKAGGNNLDMIDEGIGSATCREGV